MIMQIIKYPSSQFLLQHLVALHNLIINLISFIIKFINLESMSIYLISYLFLRFLYRWHLLGKTIQYLLLVFLLWFGFIGVLLRLAIEFLMLDLWWLYFLFVRIIAFITLFLCICLLPIIIIIRLILPSNLILQIIPERIDLPGILHSLISLFIQIIKFLRNSVQLFALSMQLAFSLFCGLLHLFA